MNISHTDTIDDSAYESDGFSAENDQLNPASRVDPPKTKRPKIQFYTFEEVQTRLQLSEATRLAILIKPAGLLGLRREEPVGLAWDCVNFQEKKIEILEVRTSLSS